jgi:hypothetical protein
VQESYPFTFIEAPKEYATMQSLCGGFLNGVTFMTPSVTGAYYIARPNELTGSYGCVLSLYVVGRWK